MESEVFLEPEPGAWASLAKHGRDDVIAWGGRTLHEWRALTRRELGLFEDKVIIATGHQAGFWHPGILAKFLAADALVDLIGRDRAASLHLVVDQDDNDCIHIDVPVANREGVLSAVSVPLVQLPGEGGTFRTPYGSHLERPTGEFSALEPVDATSELLRRDAARTAADAPWIKPALDSIPDSLRRIEVHLRAHRHAASLALQMAEAVYGELATWTQRPRLLGASRLLDTSFGRAIVEAMAGNSDACAQAYNEAVGNGEGDVRPLERHRSDWQLPLWWIDANGKRRPVSAAELASIESSSLRPRALLMTAMMRLVVCDLFIHGRGGFEYDRAMEQWIRAWLRLEVCPMTMASADLRLPFPHAEPARKRDLAQAQSAHRHLLHDPAMRDGKMSARKRLWLGEIEALPRRSKERRQRFIDYHRWLDRAREEHAAALRAATDRVARIRSVIQSQEIIRRRDWAFPLYPRSSLDALNEAIRARIFEESSIVNRQPSMQGPPDQPAPVV